MNIGLCRVSSISQKDNTSLSNQKKMIKDYCKMYGIKISNVISECFSGTTSNRSGLNELKKLVENGNVESVIVMKLDRLMRNFTEGVIFIKYLLDNDVKIISVMEQIDTSSVSGRFLVNILLSMSEMERETIVQRLSNGKEKRFNDKERVCGRIPYGYKKENGFTTVDAEESKIVDYIFKKYLTLTKRGLTPIKRMRRLRTLLVRNGYSYRGKEFTTHNINYIPRNSFYFGEMKYGDMVCKHNYETIISKRLFNLVNN